MPDNEQATIFPPPTENSGKRVMRQYYQARLGERLGQFAEMVSNRDLLRRGAKKMQDGTIGKATGEPGVEDMNIRVGDVVEQHYHEAPAQPVIQPASQLVADTTGGQTSSSPAQPLPPAAEPVESTWKTWAKRVAIVAAGAGLGAGGMAGYDWATSPEEKPPAIEQPAVETSPVPAGGYWRYGVEVLPSPKPD